MVILDLNGMTFDAVGVFGLVFWLLFKSGSSYCDIIASLFSTCLARFYFSFKIYMAENYLDFCINRYLVWIIFSNIYNFERFTNYAVSAKVGPIFPKYTSEFISKIDQEDIRKFYQKLIWNVQDWFVFQTFNDSSSNTF